MKTRTKLLAFATGAGLAFYQEDLIKWVAPVAVDWLTQGKDYGQLAEELRISGEKIYQTIEKKDDSQHNHQVFTHIIGIERWGQRRIKVALGESLVMDEYDRYRPEKDKMWHELRDEFVQTRQETIALVQQFNRSIVNPRTRIPHNQFGDFSLLGWLQYLRYHADGTLNLMR